MVRPPGTGQPPMRNLTTSLSVLSNRRLRSPLVPNESRGPKGLQYPVESKWSSWPELDKLLKMQRLVASSQSKQLLWFSKTPQVSFKSKKKERIHVALVPPWLSLPHWLSRGQRPCLLALSLVALSVSTLNERKRSSCTAAFNCRPQISNLNWYTNLKRPAQ